MTRSSGNAIRQFKENQSVIQHSIGDSIENPRDVTVCTSRRTGSKGYLMLLAGLILIAAIASSATSTAYGGGSAIRSTADVVSELNNSPRPKVAIQIITRSEREGR
jgi:hypothetical protein